MTYAIGDKIPYNGITLKVVEAPEYRCGMCFFANTNSCGAPTEFRCTPAGRDDNKSVTFIRQG